MSYLSNPTSKTDYGVVKVGNFIDVDTDGLISSPEIIAGPGVSVEYDIGYITISSTGADLINVYGTTTNYTATIDDEYIGVYSTNAVTITLPPGVNGRVYYVKDEYGQGSGKITIQPSLGETIDSKPNYVISIPNQSAAMVFRAGIWRLI